MTMIIILIIMLIIETIFRMDIHKKSSEETPVLFRYKLKAAICVWRKFNHAFKSVQIHLYLYLHDTLEMAKPKRLLEINKGRMMLT